jgi:hypothetical protein
MFQIDDFFAGAFARAACGAGREAADLAAGLWTLRITIFEFEVLSLKLGDGEGFN